MNPAPSHNEVGLALWKRGATQAALESFALAVAASPDSAELHYNLGCAQLELERFEEAVGSAREALRLRSGFSAALTLWAAGMAATGALEAGAELLSQLGGPAVAPAQRYMMLAMRLMSSKLFGPARRCLERVLREDPSELIARHLLSALSGENPERPVDGYVRQLFDASAATFDRELLSKLGYAIPREMVDALRSVEGAPTPPWDVLDLGCGTGLVGARIAPYARQLVGIDLAPNMIEHARARNIYTDLRCVDLTAALVHGEASEDRYDIITAGDVFIYVGKLDEVVPAVRRALRPGGLFAFSAEAGEALPEPHSEGYRLGLMGRYAHSADYLRKLAAESGFDVILMRATRIRSEHRRPVHGWLAIFRTPC
ncbi:MAG TPA: methyltransferase [Steroidobacteraceae bacterium]